MCCCEGGMARDGLPRRAMAEGATRPRCRACQGPAHHMANDATFEIFLAAPPGLEPVLAEEVGLKGFKRPRVVPGGVVTRGLWPDVWRANLWVRGAGRVLARIDAFRVTHLAQLDQRARRVPWASVLRPDVPFRVEATCTASRIYHSGAAAQRIATAIRETLGAPDSRRGRRPGPRAHRGRPLHHQRRYLRRAAAQARLQGGGERRADARDDGGAVPAPMRLRGRGAGARPDVRLRHLRHRGGRDRRTAQSRPRTALRLRGPRDLRRRGLAADAAIARRPRAGASLPRAATAMRVPSR
jgi:hypothetical protein